MHGVENRCGTDSKAFEKGPQTHTHTHLGRAPSIFDVRFRRPAQEIKTASVRPPVPFRFHGEHPFLRRAGQRSHAGRPPVEKLSHLCGLISSPKLAFFFPDEEDKDEHEHEHEGWLQTQHRCFGRVRRKADLVRSYPGCRFRIHMIPHAMLPPVSYARKYCELTRVSKRACARSAFGWPVETVTPRCALHGKVPAARGRFVPHHALPAVENAHAL